MKLATQLAALLRMNLAGVPARLGLVATIVIGVASAVGVLVAMLAMGVGARREAMGNVRPDRAIVMTLGAQGSMQSHIPKSDAALIREMPGVRRNAQGEPIAVSQATVFIQARAQADDSRIGFTLAGVTPGLTDYLPELHLTAGRLFRPGLRELIVSNRCIRQLRDFAVGDERLLRGGEWRIVGAFDLGHTEGNCTVYADADTILSAYHLDAYNQVNVMLQSPAAFAAFERALKANPSLRVTARHEAQVVEEDMSQVNGILAFVSYFVGAIMAAAATIGAANSLYAIVDDRRRELATLRALGFNPLAVIAAVLSESILLALPGALLGVLVAWALFDGMHASSLDMSFRLAVTPALALLGLLWALGIGALSGLLPAVRAARVPVSVALRAT